MKPKHLLTRLAAFLAALALLAALPGAALADATITVSGGSLSVTPAAITFTTVTLTGADQTSNGTTSAWTVADPTGTGAGYHITIAATAFSDGASHTIPVSGFRATLTSGNIATTSGNTAPASSMTSATALSTSAQTLLSAATSAGMGTYTATPTFTLAVPANTFAGSYTSTVTVAIVSGP